MGGPVKLERKAKEEVRVKEERKRLQTEQKLALLSFLPIKVLNAIAGKNNILLEADTSQPDLVVILSVLTGAAIVSQVPKSYLEVFLNTKGIAPQTYVAQMRSALLEFWENERTEILIDLTVEDEEEVPTKATEKPVPSGSLSNRNLMAFDAAQAVSPSPTPIHNQLPSTQNQANAEPSLGELFVTKFYSMLSKGDPSAILQSNMFSPSIIGYLFLFSPNGSYVLAEKKANGNQEIGVLLQMLMKFSFIVGSKDDKFDEYGMLSIQVKGTIVNGADCVGIFTHFFSFFKMDCGNYAIRECSFHVKTHQSYQPLANYLPYAIGNGAPNVMTG